MFPLVNADEKKGLENELASLEVFCFHMHYLICFSFSNGEDLDASFPKSEPSSWEQVSSRISILLPLLFDVITQFQKRQTWEGLIPFLLM